MSLKDFLIFVALGTLVYETIRNPTSAVVTYLRMQFLKAIGWVETEAAAVFHKTPAAPVAAPPVPAQSPVSVTINHAPVTQTNTLPGQTGAGNFTTPGVAGVIGDAATVTAIIAAAQAKIAAWLAPAIDWTKVTATELNMLMVTFTGTTLLDYATGAVTTIPAGITPSANFEIQGRVLRSEPTTESERAFVGYNNAAGIWAHFKIGPDGTLVPQ